MIARCVLKKNHINLSSRGYGVYLDYCFATADDRALVANNMIRIDGAQSTSYGIYYQTSNYYDVVFNTVSVNGANSNNRAFYIGSGDSLRIINNIFSCIGGDYTVYTNSGRAISYSDFNNLYSTGTYLGYWANPVQDINAWRVVSGNDAHSLSVAPSFVSASDLHTQQVALSRAGTPYAAVTDDIDGESRSTVAPDIGADEFTRSAPNNAGLTHFNGPELPVHAGSQTVSVALKNYGTDSLNSVALNWSVNNVLQTPYFWTGALASTQSDSVALGNYTFVQGTNYDITAWTSNPNGVTDSITSNDTIRIEGLQTAMSGTYTIGGFNPSYRTFGDAIADLASRGVAGPVVFNARDNHYIEQLQIPEIAGASAANTITFQSESGDSTGVVISYASTKADSNYTIQILGGDYIRLRKLTLLATGAYPYARVVELKNGADHIQFLNNSISGLSNANASSSNVTHMTLIYSVYGANRSALYQNNHFQEGTRAIHHHKYNSNDSLSGTRIENNHFQNQSRGALDLSAHVAPQVTGNTMETNTSYAYYIGIDMERSVNAMISGNRIRIDNGGVGIGLSNYSQNTTIANNFIYVGGTGSATGIYIDASPYVNIYYNNIQVNSSHTSWSGALSLSSNSDDIRMANNIFVNKGGGYAVSVSDASSVVYSDYNNIYTTGTQLAKWGSNVIVDFPMWQAISGRDQHSHSVDPLFVSLTDLHTQAIALSQAGEPIAGITEDIDGDTRNSTAPDIGADEFTIAVPNNAGLMAFAGPQIPFTGGNQTVSVNLKNFGTSPLDSVDIAWSVNGVAQATYHWTGSLSSSQTTVAAIGDFAFTANQEYILRAWTVNPNGVPDAVNIDDTVQVSGVRTALAGIYTIGGNNPDFNTFTEAVSALHRGGVSAAVNFHVRNGVYTEQVHIGEVAGVSAIDTICFQSETGDSAQVLLTWESTSANANYTLLLDRVDYISFHKMTLRATGSTYGKVAELRHETDHIRFSNTIFEGVTVYNSTSNHGLLTNTLLPGEDILIRNNRFVKGYQGLGYSGGKGLRVLNNRFENQRGKGLSVHDHDAPQIIGNTFSGTSGQSNYTACSVSSCTNALVIMENHIEMNSSGYGIQLQSSQGTASNRGLIANNRITILSTSYYGSPRGIYFYNNTYQNVYYNSVHIGGSSRGGRSVSIESGNNIRLVNNIFANSLGTHAVYLYPSTAISYANHNNYYTTGTEFGQLGNTVVTDLAGWQAASGHDMRSIAVDPVFASATDLHAAHIALYQAGEPISGITEDLDGALRDAAKPSIGAYEVTPPANDAALLSITTPQIPFGQGSQAIFVVVRNEGVDTLQSLDVNWSVNQAAQATHQWTGNLATGETDSIAIGSFNFAFGPEYNIKAWSENPNGVSDLYHHNDTANHNNLYTALNGIYTLGGANPDFRNFSEAADALNNRGVTGAVVFEVRDSIYNEQIEIGEVRGASAANTITFQSENGDSSQVVLTYAATSSQ